MARIPLGAKTVLNLSTDLDPMFTELYAAAGGDYTTATTFTLGNGTGQRLLVINAGNSVANDGAAISFRRNGTDILIVGDHGRVLGTSPGDGIFYTGGAFNQRFYTNGVERMRIDSSGNVGINGNPGAYGVGTATLSINATTQPIYDLFLSGVRDGFISTTTAGFAIGSLTNKPLGLWANGALRVNVQASGNLTPNSDNSNTLGAPANRWSTVYAGIGTINTSDAREKTTIEPLNANEIAAATQLAKEVGKYNFLSFVNVNENGGKKHIGMTVQRAIEVMEENDLDPDAYAFIVYDQWETGDPEKPMADRYSFRTDQLSLFIARAQAQRQDELEARIAALESFDA